MKIEELNYGKKRDFWLVPVTPQSFSDRLAVGREVRLWKNDHAEDVFLAQGELVYEVRNETPQGLRIENLCATNFPRLSWLVDRKPAKNASRLLVRVHQFARELPPLPLELAVDEKIVEQASKFNPRVRSVGEVIEWLQDQCLLSGEGAKPIQRAFMSVSKNTAGAYDDGFVLHGKALRVFVRRVQEQQTSGETSEFTRVEKITRSRAGFDPEAIILVSGAISFCDRTTAGKLKAGIRAVLDAALQSDQSFHRMWEGYGQLEERMIIDDARVCGALAYSSFELQPDGSFRFDLVEPLGSERLAILKRGNELEAGENPPDFDQLEASLSSGDPMRRNNCQFTGELKGKPHAASHSIILSSDAAPPPSGYLSVAIGGDIPRLQRRRNVQESIRTGQCEMMHLGLLLEGKDLPSARHIEHKAITPRVLEKVFRRTDGTTGRPTRAQEDAIRAALETPDIALIQGPPGTGKTTVLRAIIERLNEIADSAGRTSGEFLVTGFQHDAVENAIEKLDVNDLPAIKLGRRGDRDEFKEVEMRLDSWRYERASRIRERIKPSQRCDAQRKVRDLVHSYVLAPGDLKQTLATVEAVARQARGAASLQTLLELDELTETLREALHASRGLTAEQRVLIRALRGLRTVPEAFADDGPQTAQIAMLRLRRVAVLESSVEALLRKAAAWSEEKTPPFLGELAELRRRLLLGLLSSAEIADGTPRSRHDVTMLLGRIQTEMEERFRESSRGPDATAADFLFQLENNPSHVRRAILAYTPVFAATCQQAASHRIAEVKGDGPLVYDTVLVDEAARANPLDLLIPMAQARRRIILVGDHRQLPHMIDAEIERQIEKGSAESSTTVNGLNREKLKESLFEHLFTLMRRRQEQDHITRVVTLDEQYRMHPQLGDFVNEQFYKPFPSEGFRSPRLAPEFHHELEGYQNRSAVWVDVPRDKGLEASGQSKSRPVEAQWIARELKRIIDGPAARNLTFGVITFYSKQVEMLGAELARVGLMTGGGSEGYQVADAYRYLVLPNGKRIERLRTGSVDAFQGKEFDVVFLSMVRSNDFPDDSEKERLRKYGHLMSPHRLCVSMSRQKRLLVVVGDEVMLEAPNAKQAIAPLVAFRELCRADSLSEEGGRK